MIEEYSFGFIKIDGETYNHDVQIGLDDKTKLWWRNQSHQIDKRSLEEAIDQKPEVIVVGTGEIGVAQVTKETRGEIESKGVKLIVEPTTDAVKTYNSLKKENKKVAGLFHLTC